MSAAQRDTYEVRYVGAGLDTWEPIPYQKMCSRLSGYYTDVQAILDVMWSGQVVRTAFAEYRCVIVPAQSKEVER